MSNSDNPCPEKICQELESIHEVYVTAEELSIKKAIAKTLIAIIRRPEETEEAIEEEVFCGSSSLYAKTQECFCISFHITHHVNGSWCGEVSGFCFVVSR